MQTENELDSFSKRTSTSSSEQNGKKTSNYHSSNTVSGIETYAKDRAHNLLSATYKT